MDPYQQRPHGSLTCGSSVRLLSFSAGKTAYKPLCPAAAQNGHNAAMNRSDLPVKRKTGGPSIATTGQSVPTSWAARRRRPNLLILGASGHVAAAFLRRLGGRRDLFNAVALLDRNDHVLKNRFLEHSRLRYTFVRHDLHLKENAAEYVQLLRKRQIDIVLDLTDLDTLPVFKATDAAGVSYINTALNDASRGVHEMVAAIHPTRKKPRRTTHIISSGMNPGAVNIWVKHGVRHYGVPQEVIHFEYDDSMSFDRWRPLITWSRREFLTETVWEPTGQVKDGQVRIFNTNALANRIDLRPIMEPVIKLPEYPHGFLVLHEENIKLAHKFGMSSKYVYALHPRTMDYLVKRWQERSTVLVSDLELGDNTSMPLTGSDTIGVCLQYPRERVYYVHSLSNQAVVGTNATCAQVSIGVWAALLTMLTEPLESRVYFPSDLYDTIYPHVLYSNQRVELFECSLHNRKWIIDRHVPELHPRLPRGREQAII